MASHRCDKRSVVADIRLNEGESRVVHVMCKVPGTPRTEVVEYCYALGLGIGKKCVDEVAAYKSCAPNDECRAAVHKRILARPLPAHVFGQRMGPTGRRAG